MENQKANPPGHDEKTVKIYVNTEPHEVTKGKISYEQVVALAYSTPPAGENILITVKYRRGASNNEGFLQPGEDVQVHEGMIFNVSATDKS